MKKYINSSLYFIRGNASVNLSVSQQKQIADYISTKPFTQSIMIYDPMEPRKKLEKWRAALPWIKPYFAMKTCPSSLMIADYAKLGVGMDCATKIQMQQCLEAGVPIENIIYSNPIKNQVDLFWAGNNGVSLTTADCLSQIKKQFQFAPKKDILWRIAVKQEESDNLTSVFSRKFGDDLSTNEQIEKRMKQLFDMGINLKGIHFHSGSGPNGSTGFGKGVELARRCLQIGRKKGLRMQILDIGGGFAIDNIPKSQIQALKPTYNDPLGYKVIAEPGRFLSSTCFLVLSRIIGQKTKYNKKCYYINQSIYHCFNCMATDSINFDNDDSQFYSKITNGQVYPIQNVQGAIVYGMTLDGGDILCRNLKIPVQAKIGDLLCFGGMGAYTQAIKTKFNGMSSADEVYILKQSNNSCENNSNKRSQNSKQNL